MSKLAVILVNYRGWRDTLACVESLRVSDYSPLDIIVVENGSPDESYARLQDLAGVHLIKLERNLGFAAGCNVGMRAARARGAEFIWLLNNDTVVERRAASVLVDLAHRHDDAHFFGCLIAFASDPSRLWFGGGEFDPLTGTVGHVGYMQRVEAFSSFAPAVTQWISGCSLLVRTSSLDRVGYMDEDLFLYGEDLDWQLRAAQHGSVAMIARECLVHHKVGQSTGSTDDVLGRTFMSRNFLKLARRYAGRRLPFWLGRWAFEYVVKPAVKRQGGLVGAGLAGLLTQQTSGTEIVDRFERRASTR